MLWLPCEHLQYVALSDTSYVFVVKQQQARARRRQLRSGRQRGTREAKTNPRKI